MQITLKKKYKININANKTKIFVRTRNSAIRANIYLDNQLLISVHKVKYLRSCITSNGK